MASLGFGEYVPTHYSVKSKKTTAAKTNGATHGMTDEMTDETSASNTKTTEADEHSALDGSPPTKFIDIKDLLKKVECRRIEIIENDRNCYLAFNQVDFSKYREIIDYRDKHCLWLRFNYFLGASTLIIKIPSGGHEEAHANFARMVTKEATLMGIPDEEHWLLASKTQMSQHRPPSHLYSVKEGDSSITNLITRPQSDSWPVFVIEAGNSESLARLKTDAKWWLENSEGKVLMVILIKVNKMQRTIQILKYVPILNPTRYSFRSHPKVLPSLTAEVSIDISVVPPQVQGAPLILEFDRLFDRVPNPPAEGDIVLSNQCLGTWAVNVLTRM